MATMEASRPTGYRAHWVQAQEVESDEKRLRSVLHTSCMPAPREARSDDDHARELQPTSPHVDRKCSSGREAAK